MHTIRQQDPDFFTSQLNFILAGLRAGELVDLDIERQGRKITLQQRLQPSIGTGELAANIAVGCLFWLFGMLILFLGKLDRNVVLFFFMSMSLSLTILVYGPENDFGINGWWWLGVEPILPEQVTLLFSPLAAASLLVAVVRYRL